MPNYAIYKNNIILNVIIADSKEIAESITDMKAVETDNKIGIGWIFENNKWIEPTPAIEETIPSYPQDGKIYIWNKETKQWQPIEVIS
jgi:hypothetical protein